MKFFAFLILFCGQIFAFDLNFKNFSADFSQNVSSKQGKIDYSGSFFLQNDKAFWSYEKPSKKEIYINNNEIMVVEHDLEQVLISKLDNVPKLNEIFKKAKKLGANKFKARYENIDYIIELENDEVKKISYRDELENLVSITLFNPKRNQNIDTKIFTPKYPANYDIVR